MSEINTEYLKRCLATLEMSYSMIKSVEEGAINYEMYRNSLVKSFEMTLEQSGKLLRKKLVPYFASKREADKLSFKDIFRYAFKFSLINEKAVERWFACRDNRNSATRDHGQKFAEKTLSLIEPFINDAKQLEEIINHA